MLRSSQPQDPAFDACVSATCAAVLTAVSCHGLRALQATDVAAAIACIAHRSNAALILKTMLASQHCKDAPGNQRQTLLFLPGYPCHFWDKQSERRSLVLQAVLWRWPS